MTACNKHSETPVKGYSQCAGCEIDALRTQVAELRAENEAHLEKIGELGAAGFFDRVGITDQLCDERNALLDENQALRDQLEAARRGTSEAIDLIDCISRHPSNRIPVLDQARGALVKVLTATPAPEVQCKACNDTACDQSHEELVPCPGCAAKPAHVDGFHGDDTALVSSAKALLALDEKVALTGGGIGSHARTIIGSFIVRMAEQGERQQPGPDVRGLVEALEHAYWFIHNGIQLGFIDMPDDDVPSMAHDALPMIEKALAPYRQAQQGDSHDT